MFGLVQRSYQLIAGITIDVLLVRSELVYSASACYHSFPPCRSDGTGQCALSGRLSEYFDRRHQSSSI